MISILIFDKACFTRMWSILMTVSHELEKNVYNAFVA